MRRIYLFLYVSPKFFVETEHKIMHCDNFENHILPLLRHCCWYLPFCLLFLARLHNSIKVCIFGCVWLLLSSLLDWVSVQLMIRSFLSLPLLKALCVGTYFHTLRSKVAIQCYGKQFILFCLLDLFTAACIES